MTRAFFAAAAAGMMLLACVGSAPAASPVGGRCGGFLGIRCNPGLTCRMPPGPGADRMGVCVPAMIVCPRIYRPVCGRDGRTYSNDCVMRAQHVPMWHPGRC